jgi:transcriptional regulator with XRE-family HTH domain
MAVRDLRTRRLALGMTQRQLAVAMGVHWNSIARWERGEMTMLHCHLLMLRALEVQACTATAVKQ